MNDEYAPGEAVIQRAVQRNAAGQIISEVIYGTYGYDNATANEASLGIAGATLALARQWADIKKTPPGQAK